MLIASGYLSTLDSIMPIEKRCQIPVVTPRRMRSARGCLAGLDGGVMANWGFRSPLIAYCFAPHSTAGWTGSNSVGKSSGGVPTWINPIN